MPSSLEVDGFRDFGRDEVFSDVGCVVIWRLLCLYNYSRCNMVRTNCLNCKHLYFEVTLWEIFSLAQHPFPGVTYNTAFVGWLKSGHRLEKPFCANSEMYDAFYLLIFVRILIILMNLFLVVIM